MRAESDIGAVHLGTTLGMPATRGVVPAGAAGVQPRRMWAVALSAVAPGLGSLAIGRWATGGWILAGWAIALATLAVSGADLARTYQQGRIEDWIALAVLGASLVGFWAWGMWDVAVAATRPIKRIGVSQWRLAGRRFRRNRLAMAGLAIMALLYWLTLLAPYLAPYDPNFQGNIVLNRYLQPSAEHLFGTDKFGRDVFSRILYGARISLTIGFLAVAISITLGTLLGSIAGYFRGWIDTAIARFIDMLLSIPRLILLLVIIAIFQPSIWLIIAVLGLTGWESSARIVRGQFLQLREQEFVQASRALGYSDWRIMMRHILPNTLAPIIVIATLNIGNTILLEAALSFLGLGVQPPTASWGSMVNDGRDAMITAWWISTFPGLAIVVTVVSFNLLGDGLRDALDPRLSG
ncbi:MAG TPA: oligopeptide ABC transporter permease [Gemmatimonadota bacterium]|nr:oligopeptide ABC transporter permease [Gemmatimonadota bacterium]